MIISIRGKIKFESRQDQPEIKNSQSGALPQGSVEATRDQFHCERLVRRDYSRWLTMAGPGNQSRSILGLHSGWSPRTNSVGTPPEGDESSSTNFLRTFRCSLLRTWT